MKRHIHNKNEKEIIMNLGTEIGEARLDIVEGLNIYKFRLELIRENIISSNDNIQDNLEQLTIANELLEILDESLSANEKFDTQLNETLNKYGLID